jgi:hypothetical protein
VIANFAVRRRAYLAPDGSVLRDLPDFAGDQDLVISLYRAMVLARTFDLKAVSLQRTGRLGTYCHIARPRSRCGRHRQRHAGGRCTLSLLSRQCCAALAWRD